MLSGTERRRPRHEREQEKKKSSVGRILRNFFLALVSVALLAVIGCYVAGMVYFRDKFFWNTTINGVDVSEMTAAQVEDRIAAQLATYRLEIVERGDISEFISADQIAYHYVSKGETMTFLRGQDLFRWPVSFWQSSSYTFDSSAQYDDAMLMQAIEGLAALDEEQTVPPQDAYIDFLDGTYQVVAEVEGNRLNEEQARRLIREAVDFGNVKLSLEEQNCYLIPAKRRNDEVMAATCKTLNTYIGTEITYLFGDRKEILDKGILRDWVTYDDYGTVTLDENQVYEYVYQLAKKYDSADKPREFVTHYGTTVSVEGGYYGWVIDQDATAAELLDAIYSGYQGDKYAVFAQTAESWDNSDLGDSYVEIDLGSQHVWLYIDGQEVVSTDCVSGTASQANRYTPSGTYTLYYKESPSVLKGEMKSDGTPEYETKVNYWMPFNGGIGLHDATWRGSFGGNIYLTDGSHGCVNLPLDAARAIYEQVYNGIPIICYY